MKNTIQLLLICFLLIMSESCGQLDMTFDNREAIEFAKKAIQIVKEGNKDELKLLIHDEMLPQVREEDFDSLIQQGQRLLSLAEMPNDSLIQQSNKVNYNNFNKIEIAKLSFPFTLNNSANPDSIVYINVAVRDKKIIAMTVYEHPFGIRFIE